jgi:hypothetical protein
MAQYPDSKLVDRTVAFKGHLGLIQHANVCPLALGNPLQGRPARCIQQSVSFRVLGASDRVFLSNYGFRNRFPIGLVHCIPNLCIACRSASNTLRGQ